MLWSRDPSGVGDLELRAGGVRVDALHVGAGMRHGGDAV